MKNEVINNIKMSNDSLFFSTFVKSMNKVPKAKRRIMAKKASEIPAKKALLIINNDNPNKKYKIMID
jgi:hypothetical protein